MTTERLAEGALLSGRYEIQQVVGRGGMGTVYRALDRRLDIVVAVKEMNERFAPPEERDVAVRQFEREAKLLGQLVHRNLPRVTDYFVEDDHCYLIMEFVQGQTIERRIREGENHPPLLEVLDWGVQLADVLTYLHGQEPPIVFRDMKPANIMLQDDGTIKLIDFGIARRFQAGATKDTLLYGSPGYSPPEQYGRTQTDARSDIYALAATLHHLVTRRDPAPTPFKFPPIRTIDPTLPARLETLLDECLQMDVDKRCQTAGDVRQALIDTRAEVRDRVNAPAVPLQPIEQRPPAPRVISSRLEAAERAEATRRVALIAGSVVALVVIGWAVVAMLPRARKDPSDTLPKTVAAVQPAPPAPVPEHPTAPPPGDQGQAGGTLHVTSAPAGAAVLVDGQDAGRTPCDVSDVPPGRHLVLIVPPDGSGLVQAARDVEVQPGDTIPVDVTLAQAPPPPDPAAHLPLVQFGPISVQTGAVHDPMRPRADRPGALVHVPLRVIGAARRNGIVSAFFYALDGVTPMRPRGAASPYQNTSGQLSVSHSFQPDGDVSDYPDLTLFVPEGAFPAPYDQVTYRVVAFVDGKPVAQSPPRPLLGGPPQ